MGRSDANLHKMTCFVPLILFKGFWIKTTPELCQYRDMQVKTCKSVICFVLSQNNVAMLVGFFSHASYLDEMQSNQNYADTQ